MHIGNIADALDAGVYVDGEGHGGVIVVEQGRVCESVASCGSK